MATESRRRAEAMSLDTPRLHQGQEEQESAAQVAASILASIQPITCDNCLQHVPIGAQRRNVRTMRITMGISAAQKGRNSPVKIFK